MGPRSLLETKSKQTIVFPRIGRYQEITIFFCDLRASLKEGSTAGFFHPAVLPSLREARGDPQTRRHTPFSTGIQRSLSGIQERHQGSRGTLSPKNRGREANVRVERPSRLCRCKNVGWVSKVKDTCCLQFLKKLRESSLLKHWVDAPAERKKDKKRRGRRRNKFQSKILREREGERARVRACVHA